ncbi:MAG: hypothetical protein R2755_07730 [Acidimicrobiales bacterium]
MVGPEHPADRRYIAVQAGDGDRHRPLQDEARRRLERVRASIEAELDGATATGDATAIRHAAEQLRAIDDTLARQHPQTRRDERPDRQREHRDAPTDARGGSDRANHREAQRGRSVDA